MTLKENRKRIRIYFAAIIFLYVVVLGSLFFFTPGLNVIVEEINGTPRVRVGNSSVHTIKDIQVSTAQGTKLLYIGRLLSGESAVVPLEGLSGRITIIAEAPFHAKKSNQVNLMHTQGLKLNYETAFSPNTKVGIRTPLLINVCNAGTRDIEKVLVQEEHDPEFFSEENGERTFSLAVGACNSAQFQLTPTKGGKTQIYFNINALDLTESFMRVIEIQPGN